MTCFLTDLHKFSEKDIDEYTRLMPRSRIEKAHKYYYFKDKRLCVLAYILLLYTFEKIACFDILQREFTICENEKPAIHGIEPYSFNLSHCSSAVACVVSEGENGIDVQDAVNGMPVHSVFSKEEYIKICEAIDSNDYAVMLWTQKEAYCKYLGCGLKSLSFLKNCLVERNDNVRILSKKIVGDTWISVCSEMQEVPISVSAEKLREFAVKKIRMVENE